MRLLGCWIFRARQSCSTSRRHCFCMFYFYNLLLLPLQECEVQWLWMFFFCSLFSWRGCECVRVVSSCYVLICFSRGLLLIFVLLRTVKRINLCLFFVSSLTDWIRLFCFFFLCWWFYRILLYFFLLRMRIFFHSAFFFFNVVVDNLYPLLLSFLWFSLILILVVYL